MHPRVYCFTMLTGTGAESSGHARFRTFDVVHSSERLMPVPVKSTWARLASLALYITYYRTKAQGKPEHTRAHESSCDADMSEIHRTHTI